MAAASLLVAPSAVAHWSTAGSGSGTAGTSAAQPLSLTAGTPTSALYPGGLAPVALTVSNPNPAGVHVGRLVLDTGLGADGFAVDDSHPTCSTSSLSFSTQTHGGSGWDVPAMSGGTPGALPLSLTGALGMATSADDACQGATFTVYLRAEP